MFSKTINKIKQKIKNKEFKSRIREEKRKIFIDTIDKKEKFSKKRKQITFKFPKIQNNFVKDNLKLVIIFSIILIMLIITLALFSPIFNIKKININLYDWSQKLVDLNIAYKSIDYFRSKNIILVEKNEIQEQLTNYQKNINEIKVNKDIFKRELNIKVGSYKPLFYTIFNWKKYIISENGVFIYTNNYVFKDIKEIKLSLSEKNKEFIEYKQILNEEYLQKIIKFKNDIEQNVIWVKVKNMYYFQKEREVHFDINNDIKLIFDLNVEIDEQLKKLIVFSKEHKNLTKVNNINYIDLRIPNKVYYCENEFILNCKKNLKLIYDLYE